MWGVVFFSLLSLYWYQGFREKRDFELKCAYFYCYMRIKELDKKGKSDEMEYYYQVGKGFQNRIADHDGMETAIKKVESIYWKYDR